MAWLGETPNDLQRLEVYHSTLLQRSSDRPMYSGVWNKWGYTPMVGRALIEGAADKIESTFSPAIKRLATGRESKRGCIAKEPEYELQLQLNSIRGPILRNQGKILCYYLLSSVQFPILMAS